MKEFEISIVKMPKDKLLSHVSKALLKADSFTDDEILIIHGIFEHFLPTINDEDLMEEVGEDDLFSLSKDSQEFIRKRIAVIRFAKESIKNILVPYITDCSPRCGNVAYKKIESSVYAMSGGESYRFSFSNSASAMIKLLSSTNTLENL